MAEHDALHPDASEVPELGPEGHHVADVEGPTGHRRKLAARLSTVVGLVVGAVTCAFVVNELASEWSRVREAITDASPVWIAVGLVCCALGMTSIGWAWADVLALLGAPVRRGRVLAWYFVGELGKYLPGGVWPVLGRGELARRGGVPGPRAYASVALSLVTLYLAAMLVAVGLLPFALGDDGPGATALLLLLLPLGLAALHPRVLGPVLDLVRRVTKRPLAIDVPPWRGTVAAVLRYVPTWLLNAGGTVAVAHAVAPDEGGLARIAFAATLSWIAGFLAVAVPAGAGVREAVFLAACGMPSGLGATVAVATRVLFIVVDLGGAAIAAPFVPRSTRTADAEPVEPVAAGS
ncbi:flippase-like domain-containing protein [Iamia sp. SCSIO 61187]|uniref:lysylphosphatidylglycerol synthase transmembrane domain-containing protein n=1 Tax=Iamia sp. SCSIO 61187 TaxID=2722752 RepID=UPI001C635BA4|nr:lysylphosphatidylglycerol synthase transmembrane domain-containing protein [Iamia sp. SCSIO 61187]QYG92386.1 flippase-like domain-containing protein [Iamia sp. SCSIO 61187]